MSLMGSDAIWPPAELVRAPRSANTNNLMLTRAPHIEYRICERADKKQQENNAGLVLVLTLSVIK
jgi:hypothetical protein